MQTRDPSFGYNHSVNWQTRTSSLQPFMVRLSFGYLKHKVKVLSICHILFNTGHSKSYPFSSQESSCSNLFFWLFSFILCVYSLLKVMCCNLFRLQPFVQIQINYWMTQVTHLMPRRELRGYWMAVEEKVWVS